MVELSPDEPHPAVDDPVFGTVRWRWRGRALVLTGDAVPEVELVRTGAGPARPEIPIGTRRSRDLAMTVGGRPVELRPSRGAVSRRSYRVRVRTADGDLLLTPSSPTASRLVRGRGYRGDNELGVVERDADGSVFLAWSGPVAALGVAVDALVPEPHEAAIGYALAVGFGTGAQFFLAAVATGLENLLPG